MTRFSLDSRTDKIVKNVAASFLVKMLATLITFLMVPLTLECLGEYRNGVWLTISSMLVWIDQMDIGLGNGLRNQLAIEVAHDDKLAARKVVSSTMAMLACIVLPFMLLLLVLVQTADVYYILHVEETMVPDLRVALQAAIILVCMTFVLKFTSNVYMGMQLPAVSNVLIAIGQGLALVATWLLLRNQCATFVNVVLVNTAAPLLTYLLAYPVTFFGVFPELRPSFSMIDLRAALKLGNMGLRFFWLQIASVIQFMTANILISKFFTPQMVTPYQIAYRYLSIALVAFTVICMPYWNASTDAYERGDIAWLRQADKRMNWLSLLLAAGIALMVAVSPVVYGLWIGNKCVVPWGMTVTTSVYIFLLILSTRFSYFLNGLGALRLQLYMTVTVVLYIPLAWYVSRVTHDIDCFILVMCACLVPSIIVNKIQFSKILSGKATGIWKI